MELNTPESELRILLNAANKEEARMMFSKTSSGPQTNKHLVFLYRFFHVLPKALSLNNTLRAHAVENLRLAVDAVKEEKIEEMHGSEYDQHETDLP